MPTVKKFGQRISLDPMLLEADPKETRSLTQAKGDLLYGKVLETINQWTAANGDRLISPDVVVSCDPRGLLVDIRMAVVPAFRGLSWFVREFNTAAFHLRCQRACEQVGVWWRQKHYDHSIEFTEEGWQQIKSMHRRN